MSGWIKLHRKIRNNPVLKCNPVAKAFFVDLLLEAAHEPREIYVSGSPVNLERGQAVISVSTFAADIVGCSRQEARTIMQKLLRSDMIKVRRLPTNGGVILTICNYETYQGQNVVANQAINQPPTNEQPTSIKKEKNQKNQTPRVALETDGADTFDQWWSEFPKKVAKGQALKAYHSKIRAKVSPAVMLDGLRRSLVQWKREGREERYMPNGATWLNGESWADEYQEKDYADRDQRRIPGSRMASLPG